MSKELKLKYFFDSYEISKYVTNKDIKIIDNCFLTDYSDSNSFDESFEENYNLTYLVIYLIIYLIFIYINQKIYV